ncbi:Fic family protein [Aeromicrobium sp. UBA7512]|uniref:Fic family protein n=1 Tax=Aeromicrobium sp. UBA7512 TaxID=1945962 RepID=UPI002580D000|nr:Fic family protein [Aeromicrobium sp. UBA7512]
MKPHERNGHMPGGDETLAAVSPDVVGDLVAVERVDVEPSGSQMVPWTPSGRGGSYDDRTLHEVEVSVVPDIADLVPSVGPGLSRGLDQATEVITTLDRSHADVLTPLATLLLRAESVASSKIENIKADVDEYARALHGVKENSSAVAMVASTRALRDLIGTVDDGSDIVMDSILAAHRTLMAADPSERDYAGKARDMQNWIGGSDYSPLGAMYVPPAPTAVEHHLADLMSFCNRRNVHPIVQASIAHAQFESIHPFTDGNGRIGRALVNTILRRRRVTTAVVVPIASAIVARRDDYFDALAAHRAGDAGPLIAAFTAGSLIAASESSVSAHRLAQMPERWIEDAGRPRAGSAARKLISGFATNPVFSADDLEQRFVGATSSMYVAIENLTDAGVIRPLTKRTRNQVWVVSSIADELDALSVRIASRARTELRS